jgi:hypothetical protein
MGRNIARVELTATISLWTISIAILGKWHTDYLKFHWLICVINITYLNSNMFDVFVFIQIDQHRLCLSISAIELLSCTCSVWAVKKHWLVKCLLSTVTDQDIIVLIPDSCWAMIRNGNSTRADFTEDTVKKIRTTLVSALFRQFNICLVCFLTLLYKYNIRTLSGYIKLICTRCETHQKSSQKDSFSNCFKASANKSFFSTMCIVYMNKYPKWENNLIWHELGVVW